MCVTGLMMNWEEERGSSQEAEIVWRGGAGVWSYTLGIDDGFRLLGCKFGADS